MNNLKILIVEDEPGTQAKLERNLKNRGYEVNTAVNGVEAVDLISKSYFDVVLTDMVMPGQIDGIGVLEYTKAKHNSNIQLGKGVKVVMLTASKTSDSVLSAFNEGCEAYLVKPFNKASLSKALSELGLIVGKT